MNKKYIFHVVDNQLVCFLVSGFLSNDFDGYLKL